FVFPTWRRERRRRAVHGADLRGRGALGDVLGRRTRELVRALPGVLARRAGGRSARGRARARPDPGRDDRPHPQRRDARHRRPLRGGEGGARRLLRLRVQLDRRSRRLGRAHPERRARCDRGPARVLRPGRGAPMNYAMLIYGDDATWVDLSGEERERLRQQEMPAWVALFDELRRVDPKVSGKELDARGTAKVVRVRDGERIVTDGPFAETKEILGGVFFTELPDLDEAIRLAGLIPAAEATGAIEIRPILQ